MPRDESIRLVEEAFARAGRDDPRTVRDALGELSWAGTGSTPREAAVAAIRAGGLRVAEGGGPIAILPTGRDPALVAALDAFERDVAAMRARILAIGRERSDLIVAAAAARLSSDGRPIPAAIDPGGTHSCDGSPSGLCCYDPDSDPARDDCLFCGGPDERR